jgi:hypothetical protein
MTIPEQLKVLVARFEEHKDVYTSGDRATPLL